MLLERARMQWQFGDWESLVEIHEDALASHPSRSTIALMVATAHQQLGNHVVARRFIERARAWGSDRSEIARILIAGVHNTLAKASALMLDPEGALNHFRLAVDGAAGDSNLAAQARAIHEVARLGLYKKEGNVLGRYTINADGVPSLVDEISRNHVTIEHHTGLAAGGYPDFQRMQADLALMFGQQRNDLLKAARQIEETSKKQAANLAKQIEAHLNIQAYLRDGSLQSEMHGWPVSPDFAYVLIQLIERNNYDLIIEFGSGTSTVLIAKALSNTNKRRSTFPTVQVAFEHLEKYHAQTRADLMRSGLAGAVKLVHAPLQPYTAPNRQTYPYYDCEDTLAALSRSFTSAPQILALVDGPPGSTGKNARYPALPLIMTHFPAAKVQVLLDDFIRDDEKEVVELWVNNLHERKIDPGISHLDLEKEACLIECSFANPKRG